MHLQEEPAPPANTEKRKPKRKSGKKSRLLTKAKKFGSQGKLGRGFEIDTETYNYFLRVLELWQKQEFKDEEEKESFITATFLETKGKEIDYSSNQMTSRVIENLLPFASCEILNRFCTAFSDSLRTISADPFASHVLEKLIEITSSDKFSKDKELLIWFQNTSKYALNNLEEFCFDRYANHVLRKACMCLVGFVTETGQSSQQLENKNRENPNPNVKKTKLEEIFGQRIIIKENIEIFSNFFKNLINWPQFRDLFESELTCGFVQSVFKSCSRVDSMKNDLKTATKLVLKTLGDELDLSKATHANLYTRMIEVLLTLNETEGKIWNKIFSTYFEGKLNIFGNHEKGKFCLKKLLESCPDAEMFQKIFDELDIPKIYSNSKSIFLNVSENCKKFQTRQSEFVHSLIGIFGEEDLVMKIVKFGNKEDRVTDYVGSFVLQNLFGFHKPKMITKSLLDTPPLEIIKVSTDGKGSHVIESFFASDKVGEKNKEKLLGLLKEHLITLSLNKFGSRILDKIWSWSNLKQKNVVASVLANRLAQLNANQFGKFIAAKWRLGEYKRDAKMWGESIEKGDKRTQEVQDILNEFEDAKEEKTVEEEQPKKKKKSKDQISNEVLASQELPSQSQEEEKTKKKKKKKKREIEPDSTTVDEVIEDDEPLKKKKKKSKKSE